MTKPPVEIHAIKPANSPFHGMSGLEVPVEYSLALPTQLTHKVSGHGKTGMLLQPRIRSITSSV
jgi:hypothetical protein